MWCGRLGGVGGVGWGGAGCMGDAQSGSCGLVPAV